VEAERAAQRRDAFVERGVPAALAEDVAVLQAMAASLDIADIAARRGWPAATTAGLYRALGAALGLDRVRAGAADMALDQHWDRLAVRRMGEDLYEDQRVLTDAALAHFGVPPEGDAIDWGQTAAEAWLARIETHAAPARETIADLDAHGPWTFAKLTIAAAELHALAAAARA
jgi:glutamate dehydrogenase